MLLINEEELARLFHETYERLAPKFGYETRPETREFLEHTNNGRLMIAVCKEILSHINTRLSGAGEESGFSSD